MAALTDAGVPGLISLSDTADPAAAEALRAGGYVAAPLPEALMSCTVRPARVDGAFRVARVRDRDELDVAIAVAAETHIVDVASARRTLGRDVDERDDVGTWIAWDGDDPASVVWLTTDDHIGVWSMMTPVRHRRRGAGRAVLTGALDDVWSGATRAALLWATPAGRPLYESVGFRPVAEGISWVPTGFEDEVAALGHPG
jgi:GNAT superfamily N-acetyltransferase